MDHKAIRKRLRDVAATGYSWVFEEYLDGINSLAAPVRDQSGLVVAAVHAHGPAYRFPGRKDADALAQKVVDAARRVSASLHGQLSPTP